MVVTSTANYQLEHFYYGQFARDGKPYGDARLLAKSNGVQDAQIEEALKIASIPPLATNGTASWALVRGQKAPFILAQAQLGSAGQSMMHFVLTPPEVLRGYGGNLTVMRGVVEEQMPTYDRLGDTLKPITLPQTGPPSSDAQVDAILNLMTHTKNQMDTISKLLAVLVEGVQIIVHNAPADLEVRAGFIEGLLALLPASARYGVTFATHTDLQTEVQAQIRFLEGDRASSGTLVFDWEAGAISGETAESDYSHFIISQLRLDAELVTKETETLTPIAGWRLKRGDSLGEALGYAAHRLKVDNAVKNNQPVEIDDAAKILTDDPTLTPTLRLSYGRHVLAFALALDAVEPAEPIAILLQQQPGLKRDVLEHLNEALQDDKAGAVFRLVSHWLANPMGPKDPAWTETANRAAAVHMDNLVKAGDIEAVSAFLAEFHNVDPSVDLNKAAPKLIELALPMSVRDDDVARALFLLAIDYLKPALLEQLLGSKPFVSHLPDPVGEFMPYLNAETTQKPPIGLLVSVAHSFDEAWHQLVLVRLAELVLTKDHIILFDAVTLAGLVGVALSPTWGNTYHDLLLWIVQQIIIDEERLQSLEHPGPRHLLQILLARGEYDVLVKELQRQSRLFYLDAQQDHLFMVQSLFAETPLDLAKIPAALRATGKGGLSNSLQIMASLGVLEGQGWLPSLNKVADDATKLLYDDYQLQELLPIASLMRLFRYHTERHDLPNSARAARLLSLAAVRLGNKGVPTLLQAFKMLDWEDRARVEGLEMLRHFVRLAAERLAQKAIGYFGRELGDDVRDMLIATYVMKRLQADLELPDYAEFLHVTARFLEDSAVAYLNPKNAASTATLKRSLDTLPGTLTKEDRWKIVRDGLGIGRNIVALAEQHKAKRPKKQPQYTGQLLMAETAPQNALDVVRLLGGYFASGKRYELELKPQRNLVNRPLGNRSAANLRREFSIINQILAGVRRCFPPDSTEIKLSLEALGAEIDSQWADLPAEQQEKMGTMLAVDLQKTVELVIHIGEQGGHKAFDDNNKLAKKLDQNKQQPSNPLEYLRFIAGYYKMRLKR